MYATHPQDGDDLPLILLLRCWAGYDDHDDDDADDDDDQAKELRRVSMRGHVSQFAMCLARVRTETWLKPERVQTHLA